MAAEDLHTADRCQPAGVKYRVIHYEGWGDLLLAALAFLLPPLRYVWPQPRISDSPPDGRHDGRKPDNKPRFNRLESTSRAILAVLLALKLPMALAGAAFEWLLNFLNANGGILGILSSLVTFDFNGVVFSPEQNNPSEYYSVVRWIDPRMDLIDPYSLNLRVDSKTGMLHYDSRNFADLCIMAAKLAYESRYVQQDVVNNRWKMHFRQFYDFPNAHEKPMGFVQKNVLRTLASLAQVFGKKSFSQKLLTTADQWMVLHPRTQAFIFTDKPTDANLIVLAFRGTEAFNMDAWATDFDFSFIDLGDGIGRLHLGFLEALGIADRDDVEGCSVRLKERLSNPKKELTTGLSEGKLRSMAAANARGFQDKLPPETETTEGELANKASLFERLSSDLVQLSTDNPNAQIVLTGHSLGAALAAVFGALVLLDKTEIREKMRLAERIACIYAFAQPRVGDEVFASYMNAKIEEQNVEYFRVVYAYDLVPRVPLDDRFFGFKHFGFCCFNTIMHQQKALIEEPDKNFLGGGFSLIMRVGCVRELANGLLMNRLTYGDDFRETALMTFSRFVAFLLPGLVAHAPINYVNAVRLGPPHLKTVPFDDDSTA